ncbi:UNVERIFIED_ORG: cation diffusion facilitator CzcD-associated flavoprotein CzcO [Paenarthrobacter nicotinovorans]
MATTITDNIDERVRIAIIGSGFAGLGLATILKRRGEESFVILERANDVGGTWRDNDYPGAACDIQSHLYSFSFRPNPHWSRVYARQAEIFTYLKNTAAEEGLLPHTRFGAEVIEAEWNESSSTWHITTARGVVVADVLVAASGHLSDPKTPDFPGMDQFQGTVFHSASWKHDVDLRSRRVAVVGSGASAIQVIPAIAPEVEELVVFQRSAPYVIPRNDYVYTTTERSMFARLPETAQQVRDELYWSNEARFPQRRGIEAFVSRIRTTALDHLAAQVPDDELRAKLTPDYAIGCKRILISNDFYPALQLPNVQLQTDGIARFTETGVVTAGGDSIELDAVIMSTGFQASDLPIAHRIRGRDGELLSDAWSEGGQAFATTAVHGFPNMFIMNGPNAGLGAGSIIFVVESQIDYIVGALDYMTKQSVSTLEATAEAQAAFVKDIRRRSQGTVWVSGGCSSWYLDPRNGHLTTLWPDFMSRFRHENGVFRPGGYEVHGHVGSRTPEVANS